MLAYPRSIQENQSRRYKKNKEKLFEINNFKLETLYIHIAAIKIIVYSSSRI